MGVGEARWRKEKGRAFRGGYWTSSKRCSAFGVLRAADFRRYRSIEGEQRALHARIGELEGAWEGLKASRDRAREERRMLLRRVAELEAKDAGGRISP